MIYNLRKEKNKFLPLLYLSTDFMNDRSLFNNQPIKRKKEGEEKRMTQEEMLLEAAQTGYYSVSSLDLDHVSIFQF